MPLEYQGAYVPKTDERARLAAGHPGRGGFFSPDSPEIAAEAARIEHEYHEEQAQAYRDLEALNEQERRQLEN